MSYDHLGAWILKNVCSVPKALSLVGDAHCTLFCVCSKTQTLLGAIAPQVQERVQNQKRLQLHGAQVGSLKY